MYVRLLCVPVRANVRVYDMDAHVVRDVHRYVCASTIDSGHHNQLLGFGIVPSESKEHMIWFISMLKRCPHAVSEFVQRPDIVCVTDRGTALLSAIAKCLPAASSRYCYLHLLKNIGKLSEKERSLYDTVVYSKTREAFAAALIKLEAACPAVVAKLRSIGYAKFAESMLPDGKLSFNQRTNNLSEQQMNWLSKARELPLAPFVASVVDRLLRKYHREATQFSKQMANKDKVSI